MSAEILDSYEDRDGIAWMGGAACLKEEPELFFPAGTTGPAQAQIEEAKNVCRSCGVREQCLAWALKMKISHGVWGGMSEEERKALKPRT